MKELETLIYSNKMALSTCSERSSSSASSSFTELFKYLSTKPLRDFEKYSFMDVVHNLLLKKILNQQEMTEVIYSRLHLSIPL